MKHRRLVLVGLAVLALNGCRRYSIDPELSIAHEFGKQRIDKNLPALETKYILTEAHAELGITLATAIYSTILHDPELQMLFAKLGISKADLVQAGYPSNPTVSGAYETAKAPICPPTSQFDGFWAIRGTLNISDFWQIPYKKKVAQDDVAIATKAIFERMVTATSDVTVAYYNYLYAQSQYRTVEKVVALIKNMYVLTNEEHFRKEISDYDMLLVRSLLIDWQIRSLQEHEYLYNALLSMRSMLGLDLMQKDILLSDDVERYMTPLPDAEILFEEAKKEHPRLEILKLKILQTQHQQSLAKSKILNNFQFGFEYTVWPIAAPYAGPIASIDLPVFDYQQAQREKLYKQEEQLKHEYDLAVVILHQEMLMLHKRVAIAQEKIKYYREYLSHVQHDTLAYIHENAATVSKNFVSFLTSEIGFLEQECNLNKELYGLAQAVAALEKCLGRSIWMNGREG